MLLVLGALSVIRVRNKSKEVIAPKIAPLAFPISSIILFSVLHLIKEPYVYIALLVYVVILFVVGHTVRKKGLWWVCW